MATFKNANFTKRNYDCTNIVCCQAEAKPTFGNQEWVECDESELKGLTQLYMQAGARFFGYM